MSHISELRSRAHSSDKVSGPPVVEDDPKRKLSAKQAAFVREYVVDGCATKAAIRAGYSPRTAGFAGYDCLKKPQVAAAIAKSQREMARRAGITRQMIVDEYARIAFDADFIEPVNASAKRAALADLVELLGFKVADGKEPISIIVRYEDGEKDAVKQSTDYISP